MLIALAGLTPAEPGPSSLDESPILFSTFIGGSNTDWLHDVAVGTNGSIYLTGYTLSSNFPTTAGAYQRVYQGAEDVFVLKLAHNGTRVEWSTLLGGRGQDIPWAMALGADGSVYVTGLTESTDLPTTTGAFSDSLDGESDAFVARIAADGSSLVYSTYLGAEGKDEGYSVIPRDDGSAYVAGHTESTFFPVTTGAYDRGLSGFADVFVTRLSGDGRTIQASTFLGGTYTEWEPRLARGADGKIWVTGSTTSLDYPTSPQAFQRVAGLGRDIFVTRLTPGLDGMDLSTLVARNGNDVPRSIDIGPDGQVMVAGFTNSLTFPSHEGPTDLDNYGGTDGFILALEPGLRSLDHSELIGGHSFDAVRTARYDAEGTVHLLGHTNSTNFPTTADAVKSYKVSDNHDLMYLEMDLEAHTVSHATLIGPAEGDFGMDLALDEWGIPVLAGHSRSPSFTTTVGCHDPSYNGAGDAVVLRYATDVDPPEFLQQGHTGAVSTGVDMRLYANVVDGTGIDRVEVEVWFDDGLPLVIDMDPGNGYSAQVPVPKGAYEVRYRFMAVDVLGRVNTTEVMTVAVVDAEPPWLVKDLTELQGTTGDPHEIRIQLRDNRGTVMRANLSLSIDGAVTDRPLTPSPYEPEVWNYTFRVPSGATSSITYSVLFSDEARNVNGTDEATIQVLDDDAPLLGDIDVPDIVAPGTVVTINVTAWDNVAIEDAWLEYLVSGSSDIPITKEVGPPYEPTIVAYLPKLAGEGTIAFELKARDAAWNIASVQGMIEFKDTDPPEIVAITHPDVASTGDPFMVDWEATDSSRISVMWVRYTFGEASPGNWSTILVSEIRIATVEIPVPDNATGPLHMIFGAGDIYFNENETGPFTVQVVDDDRPEADAGIDLTFKEGETVVLDASGSSDNIGIVTYRWSWEVPGADEVEEHVTNVSWLELSLAPGDYEVLLTVRDDAGNVGTDTIIITVEALDDGVGPLPSWVLVAVVGCAVVAIVGWFYLRSRGRT